MLGDNRISFSPTTLTYMYQVIALMTPVENILVSVYEFFVDYVEEIFQTYLKASKDDLDDAASKLKRMVPAPMNSMLDKQPRGDAIKKMEKRRSMAVADIPPTIPGICYILLFPLSKNLKDFTFLPFSYCSYCFVPTNCQASLMSRCLLCNIIVTIALVACATHCKNSIFHVVIYFWFCLFVFLSQCLRQLQAQLHYQKGPQRGQMQTALYLVAFPRKKPAGRTLPPPKRQRSSLMQAEKEKRTDKLFLTL